MSEPIARIADATVGYSRRTPILHDVSLEIGAGE
ncbi:MAG TPA: multidrug ABC transporter ATP-binding protein, partial [Microbacterium sp.]|nr:multidrug ABC transporter ATP-binding protein [Microbacterium sp.]